MIGFLPAFAKFLFLRKVVRRGLLVGLAFPPFRMTPGYAFGQVLVADEPPN